MRQTKIIIMTLFIVMISWKILGCEAIVIGNALMSDPMSIANSEKNIQKLKGISAGFTGCIPSELSITVVEASPALVWEAECDQVVHVCSNYDSNDFKSFDCTKSSR